jgi:hypothetical protein
MGDCMAEFNLGGVEEQINPYTHSGCRLTVHKLYVTIEAFTEKFASFN